MDAISLFSGCGGMDYGFEAAGFTTRVVTDFDSVCCQTLREARSWPVLEQDLLSVEPGRLLDIAKLKRREVALVSGGPPCQPFSKAGFWVSGEARRLADPRANTLSAYFQVIRETLPAAFVLENVAGLAFVDKDEGLRLVFDEIKKINRSEKTAYKPGWAILRAVEHGVPQLRERLFLVAFRDGASFEFPKPRFSTTQTGTDLFETQKPRSAWDALGDLGEPEDIETLKVSGKWARLLPTIPEGHNYLWHTSRGGGEPLFGWRRRYWNFLLKLAKDRPAWTIAAQPGPATGPFHWDNRRLSMRELCRLQTFPDDVKLQGDLRAIQRQAGNAVPSLLTEIIGRKIRDTLSGTQESHHPLKLLPPIQSPIPASKKPKCVPQAFLSLRDAETSHPGTGKGYGALKRAALS